MWQAWIPGGCYEWPEREEVKRAVVSGEDVDELLFGTSRLKSTSVDVCCVIFMNVFNEGEHIARQTLCYS